MVDDRDDGEGAPLLFRALLVEDDDDQVVLMLRALRALPVMTTRARTLTDARERLRDGDFALVLLDLNLPDARGLDGLRALLPLHDTVVVLTNAGRRFQQEALKAGADAYLAKLSPDAVVREVVLGALERAFARRRVRGG